MNTNWTVPVDSIKTVECFYCGNTGDVEWAGEHLAEKKYYLLPQNKLKAPRGAQFKVIEKVL